MSMHFLKIRVKNSLSFLLIPSLRKTPHAWKNITTRTKCTHSASSVGDAAAKRFFWAPISCSCVCTLAVLTHISFNVQSSVTESNSSSYLLNLVFKLFHFPLTSSSNDGFGSLGLLKTVGFASAPGLQLVFLVLLLVGFLLMFRVRILLSFHQNCCCTLSCRLAMLYWHWLWWANLYLMNPQSSCQYYSICWEIPGQGNVTQCYPADSLHMITVPV